MDLSYILNHLGEDRENYKNAVSPPVFQSSNFTFQDIAAMRQALKHEKDVPFYTRGCNPTVAILRKKIAALEKAEDSLIFSSGSAAIASAVLSQVKSGDHIICVQKPYSWTNKLLNNFLTRFEVESTMIDGTNPANYEMAIKENTRLLFLESPNSITFELQDIANTAKIAQKHGLITVIDNSYATPLYQTPIEMGIDIVTHSASKYLGGHSDIVAGVLCSNSRIIQKIFESEFMTLGGIISPNDAWLMIRGLRTLPLRLKRVSETTSEVVQFLEQQSWIKKVYYPFSASHPQYDLAKKQMSGCGGLFSVEVNSESIDQVEKFCDALNYFILACSWGGHESLVFPMSVLYTSENYGQIQNQIPWNLIRFYIGLEDADILIRDLTEAAIKSDLITN